ncbi:MAG TPA: nitroreductase family protein [Acidimicrobiales bacterium]|nr:nitroreductase family protein [Acidimicrobiales bacterium]
MEFGEVVRRRRMVRAFADRPVPRAVIDGVLDAALRAPSAGFSQGWAFLVLEGPAQTALFWELTAPLGAAGGTRWDRLRRAPVLVLPLAHRQAYLDRYGEPDKISRGLDTAEAWRVPYWLVDTSFATMTMLLAATDARLGALFFGLGGGERALLDRLGVPPGYEPIGAVALGWPGEGDAPSPSLARGRRPRRETVHYGRWEGT